MFHASVCDRAAMSRVFEVVGPTLVYHLAAVHYIPDCTADPDITLRTNVEGTRVVAELADRHGATLVFASSGAVYKPSDWSHRECDPVEPIDVYGESKLQAEQVLARFGDSRAAVVVARLFNVYGPGERTPHLIPRVVSQLADDGADQLVLGALAPVRDYVHVDDAVAALRLMADLPSNSVMNVATGRGTSVREVVDICAELLDRRLSVVQAPELVRRIDLPTLCGDASALRDATGWQPKTPISDGLASMLETRRGSAASR